MKIDITIKQREKLTNLKNHSSAECLHEINEILK